MGRLFKDMRKVATLMRGGQPQELRGFVARYRGAFISIAVMSALLNVLVLGGSIYMMLVYDSVLPSHSIPTLAGLFLMLVMVYAFQGLFDNMRTRMLGDIAMAFDRAFSRRVQQAIADSALAGTRGAGDGLAPMRDLESIRSFLASAGPATLIDLPWMVFFIAVLSILHIWIGLTALVGAAVLVALTVATDRATRAPMGRVTALSAYRNAQAESNLRHAEMLTALGMRGRMETRWHTLNAYHMQAHARLGQVTGVFGGFSRIGRMLLQSAILTVGALLVIDGKASGGVIFASSILSARALAPVDQAIGNWRAFAAARIGWRRLSLFLAHVPPPAAPVTQLPLPSRDIGVQHLVVAAPGTQHVVLQGINFRLEAGDGLAIIGPSGSGKSSLARAMVGVWQPVRGGVRLDGATLDQWQPDALGAAIGYMPQVPSLLEGTIAQNIARFEPDAPSEAIIAAARCAGVHEMIVAMAQGYETEVGLDGGSLSIGQQQRIALARALYRDPFLVVLDEPNANLDTDGDTALEAAIAAVRARGGIVAVISHRPSALAQVNKVLFLRNAAMEAFGPRDEVLQEISGRNRPIGFPQRRQMWKPEPQAREEN
jgi:ATP-binding cassette subfamily C protein PrsD